MHKLKLPISFFLTLILIFSFCLPCFANPDTYIWSPDTVTTNTNQGETTPNSLTLESGSAILIEQTTGKVLYEHNCHEPLRPASVTKVMSILLIMEAIDNRKNQFK